MAPWVLVALTAAAARAAGPVGYALSNDTHGDLYHNIELLKAALLEDYDYSTPPPRFGTERGVRVNVQFTMSQLTSVDTPKQEISFYAWWRHNWVDPRLAWRPEDWGGVAEITFIAAGEHKQVWMPDDVIFEATSSVYQMPETIQVIVYPGGGVWVSVPVESTVPCPMKLLEFPFDQQTCDFTYGSWTSSAYVVDVQPYGSADDGWAAFVFSKDFKPNTEFDLLDVESRHWDSYYACCPEPYSVISYSIKVRRHPETYLTGILLPMILATFAGFLAFVANPDSGERIGLGITVMLTNAAIYIVAFEVLPKSGQMTTITLIHLISFIFSLLTLAVSIVSVSLYSVKTSSGVMSEHELLMAFVRADADGSGSLDRAEVHEAVKKLGLREDVTAKLQRQMDKATSADGSVTLPVWYDLVGKIYQTDGIAAYHSPVVATCLGPFVRRERRERKSIVLRRVKAAIERRELAETVLGSSDSAAKDPRATLQRRSSFLKRLTASPGSAEKLGSADRVLRASPSADSAVVSVQPVSSGESPMLMPQPSARTRPSDIERGGVDAFRPSEHGFDDHGDDDRAAPERPSLPSGGTGTSYRGGRRAKLEDLITQYETSDPSEVVARRVAGYLDLFMSISLPIAYTITIAVLLADFDKGLTDDDFKGTRISHTFNGTTQSRCCFGT